MDVLVRREFETDEDVRPTGSSALANNRKKRLPFCLNRIAIVWGKRDFFYRIANRNCPSSIATALKVALLDVFTL